MSTRILGLVGALSLAGCPAAELPTEEPIEPPTEPPTEEPVDEAPLLITELMADNEATLIDPDGGSPDWIELYNPGPDAVDLAGWSLSDDPDDDDPWRFPERRVLPGEYVLVFATGDASDDDDALHAPFSLSADGEQVLLGRPDGSIAHELAYDAQQPDVSFGLAQQVQTEVVVQDGSTGRFSINDETDWHAPDFDDANWMEVILGVGFDAGGSSGPPTNAALLAPTWQSSDGYGLTGAQAVDADLSTFSHTGDADMDPWWRVDLGADHAVLEVLLFNRIGCCPERLYNITVEVLDADGEPTWTSELLNPVAEDAAPTDPGALLTVAPSGALGSGVRVSKHAVGAAIGTEWMSLAEVEVMAALAAPYASRITTDLDEELRGVSASALLRLPFELTDADFDRALLALDFDDGFVARLNGQPVARAGAATDDADQAEVPHDAAGFEPFPVDPRLLIDGANLLAITALNTAPDDDDLLLRARLELQHVDTGELAWFTEPTPGAPNGPGIAGFVAAPTVDVPRGFLETPTVVTLTSETAGATLAWTLDGSLPGPDHGEQAPPPAPDAPPEVTLDITTTTTLRAVAWRDGWATSEPVTHTWLFLSDVVQQPADPPGFPATWDGASQPAIAADYAMDPEVATDPAYAADLLTGLRAIPTLSIVMDPADLFGAEHGIYVHSTQRGRDWERPASVELILGDGSTGFATTCGVRVHGFGWRPHANTLKHALRLEFRPEYGPSKLEYPLFVDAPVERFDSIVLRSQGSRGWQDFRDPEQALYLRDAFARDTARDMGKVDGHATFVHLYLNGLYWGLYNPVERPDARFGAEYFGGVPQDYDAINRRTTTNEAVDGDLVAYTELLELADGPVDTPEGYAAVLGYLDVVDLVDYMLIHQYTSNRDGPEEFQHNNMRGIRRREAGAGFRFFVWDMEYSLWGAYDHRNIDVDVAGSISHVYARLRSNDAFRAVYDERASLHLLEGGALSAEAALERWEARTEEIFDAIVAESARWGDTDRDVPYTRDVEWVAEQARLTDEYFPFRTDVLIDQLIDAGLMSDPER